MTTRVSRRSLLLGAGGLGLAAGGVVDVRAVAAAISGPRPGMKVSRQAAGTAPGRILYTYDAGRRGHRGRWWKDALDRFGT